MAWHKITLSSEQIEEQGVLKKIEHEFEKLYIKADGPSDMALFSDNEYKDNRIGIYFSPGCYPSCQDLIQEFSGEECPAPAIGQVFLLDGNDDAEDLIT